MNIAIYAAKTDTARKRANAAIKQIATLAQFAALADVLDKARHKDKEIEVLNEREAIAIALEMIADHLLAANVAPVAPVEPAK